MNDFFYPDRRAIYFSSLEDYNNPFHYLGTNYNLSSYGFLSSNNYIDPINNKYNQAMKILENGIKQEQISEQAYFTNLLQDNTFKDKKFNNLRSQLIKIMNPKKGNIDYIALINLINKILLGENEYKATLRLEKVRLQELDQALDKLEQALETEGKLKAKHKALTKGEKVIVKTWNETITNKQELYEFLRGEYLEKHQFQAFRKYFSEVHETIDNLASKLVNQTIQKVLQDNILIQHLTTLYNSQQDVYSGNLTTFIINNILLQLQNDNRIEQIVNNTLENKNSNILIDDIVKDMNTNFETIMVNGQDSTFGRKKNGANAVTQLKENGKKIDKLTITGAGLADDILDMLEQKELSKKNDYFNLLNTESPTYKALQDLQKKMEELKKVEKDLNSDEKTINEKQKAVSKAKKQLSTVAHKLIDNKLKKIKSDLRQDFLKRIQENLNIVKIYISGPTYSEIIDGLKNYLTSNDIFIHSGPVNLKADSVRLRADKINIKTKINNNEISNLNEISSDIVTLGAEAFYQGFSDGLPRTGSSTNFAQGKEAYYNGIRQGHQAIQKAQKQTEQENEEAAVALKNLALSMKDTIIVTETDKTFNTYFKDIGFVGGSLGSNLVTQLNNFKELFDSAGIGMSQEELEWLEIAIVNCSPHALGASKRDPIEKYLSTLAGFAVFDEGSAEIELIAGTAPKEIIEAGTPQLLHLYRLDGLYYPGSYVLSRIYEQLNTTLSEMQTQIHEKTHDGAHINAKASEQIIQGKYKDMKQRWAETYNVARDYYTSINVSFLSNLFNIVKQLGEKMKI